MAGRWRGFGWQKEARLIQHRTMMELQQQRNKKRRMDSVEETFRKRRRVSHLEGSTPGDVAVGQIYTGNRGEFVILELAKYIAS